MSKRICCHAAIMMMLVLNVVHPAQIFAQSSGEYALVYPRSGSKTRDHYYNRLGIPNVYVSRKCSGEGDSRRCWPVVKDQSGNILKNFSSKASITGSHSTRYRERAYCLIRDSESTPASYVLDHSGRKSTPEFENYRNRLEGERLLVLKNDPLLDTIFSKNGDLIALTSKRIVRISQQGQLQTLLANPQPLSEGVLNNNYQGDIAAIGLSDEQILVSNLRGWIRTDIHLSAHGNRKEIFDVYPETATQLYAVVYKYVSPYNKGLYLIDADFSQGVSDSAVLFNSDERNIGFAPKIHIEDGAVVVNTKDSTHRQPVYFAVAKEDIATARYRDFDIDKPHEEEIRQEKEALMSFSAGTGANYLMWQSKSKVTEGDRTYAEVDYDISDSVMLLLHGEGRIKNIRLVLSYLRNMAKDYIYDRAEEIGGSLTKEASKLLMLGVNFDGLISDSSTFKLVAEKTELNGVAEFSREESSRKEISEFTSDYSRIGALYIKENGWFFGLDYSAYTMPSAVGFSNSSKNIVYTAFDKDFGIKAASFSFGFDKLAYTKRYETNYNSLYFGGNLGIGWSWLSMSGEIKEDAKKQTGAEDIVQSGGSILLSGDLEIGYLYQRRSKSLKGLGYVFNAGYRGKGWLMGIGQSDESDSLESDELALEFGRHDFFHGPFIQGSIIF